MQNYPENLRHQMIFYKELKKSAQQNTKNLF